jgi:hypothetical protein
MHTQISNRPSGYPPTLKHCGVTSEAIRLFIPFLQPTEDLVSTNTSIPAVAVMNLLSQCKYHKHLPGDVVDFMIPMV